MSTAKPVRMAGAGGVTLVPWLRLLTSAADRIRVGCLQVIMPDGQALVFSGRSQPELTATLIVRQPRCVGRLLFGGTTGFAEAYMNGECDTPDLSALLKLALANEEALKGALAGSAIAAWLDRLRHRSRPNTRTGSRRNIAAHYDLGNDFYAAWLDPGMTYSSALFTAPGQSLSEAQDNKLRKVAAMLGLRPGMHVLEIGCGWGSFAVMAARDFGCRVTAVTLSREQGRETAARAEGLGLADRIDVLVRDYREIEGTYDRIASIEMIEAVGETHWPVYFEVLRERLARGGVATLQAITIAEHRFRSYRSRADFIQRHIFPGGMLPSSEAVKRGIRGAGLRLTDVFAFGSSYARTLALWSDRFRAAAAHIERLGFDERFRRMWAFYLSYCEAGFDAGTIDVGHYRIERP